MEEEGGQSLRRRGTQETLISLMQLDPSPIESPAATPEKPLPSLPVETDETLDADKVIQDDDSTDRPRSKVSTTGSTATAPGLSGGGSGHGTIFYLTRIQKYSTYAIGAFAFLHLANVSLIPAVTRSVPGSETYLLMTREIYQTTTTEPLVVILPILAHGLSGVGLRLVRRAQNVKRYGGATPGMYALHRSRDAAAATGGDGPVRTSRTAPSPWPAISYISLSGYVFSVFLGAHVFMNRVLPLAVDGDSSNVGLAYVAHGFVRHPLVAYLAYGGLLIFGGGHMTWGIAKWYGMAPSTRGWWPSNGSVVPLDKETKRRRRRKWMAVQALAVADVLLWAVGGLGVVAQGGLSDGWVGKLYDDLYAKVGL